MLEINPDGKELFFELSVSNSDSEVSDIFIINYIQSI